MTVLTLARFASCALALGLLSACATAPTITAQRESSQYRVRAARNYAAPGPASDPWGPYISEASGKYDVPERWIREVMRQESGGKLFGRSGGLVTSGAGAMGLMQVMPGTYDELRARYAELGDDPYDPHNNILAGTAYIREMYDIYGSPGFLAAYNAGPGRLDDYLTRNRILPEETRRYVASIGPRISGSEPQRASPGAQFAMNNLPSSSIGAGPRYGAGSRYSAPPASASPIQLAPVAVARVAAPAPVIPAPVIPAPVIQVAEAAPGPFIKLSPQPAEAIVLAPPAPLAQIAQAPEPPAGRFIRLEPQPQQQFAQLPEPAFEPRAQVQAQLQAPVPAPLPAPSPRSYAQFAQLPQPPSAPLPLPPAPAQPPRSASQMAAAALVPVAPRGSPFGLVSQANAEPIGMHRGGFGTSGGWAVQVGAFANEGLASSAAASARDHARDLLGAARPSVMAVRQPGGMLYRARLSGLSRDAAAQACERLSRARTNCMMVSPDAQS